MTIEFLKQHDLLLFECISGSKAYGLDLPTSDTDIKGVFVLPADKFFGLEYIPQINDKSNDKVYYELKRFVELLAKNNPNLLEMLNTPERFVLYKHPLFDKLSPDLFLSKLCKKTFAGYAMTQIKKARGLNKKIMNPMAKEKKTVLDFCYVNHRQGAVPLKKWLEMYDYQQANCGLVNIPHMRDLYGIYHSPEEGYKGIVRPQKTVDTILLSSVTREAQQVGVLYFNKDGYKKYCKDYKNYWDWVEKRNEARYQNTLSHGKNYDAKNMMHTFRLLDMAAEILEEGEIRVFRPNREELLAIRRGEFSYDTLIEKAEVKLKHIEQLYTKSTLPEIPNLTLIEKKLIEVRRAFYKE